MDLTLKKIAGFAAILACLIGGAPAEAGIFSRKKAPKEDKVLTGAAKDSAEMAKKFAGAKDTKVSSIVASIKTALSFSFFPTVFSTIHIFCQAEWRGSPTPETLLQDR